MARTGALAAGGEEVFVGSSIRVLDAFFFEGL